MIGGVVLLTSAIGLLSGAREASLAGGARTLVANAPEAGIMATAGPRPGWIRVLFARNGGMVLLREISAPGEVRELSLSADGNDLFVATGTTAYTLSTRTGYVEAQALATGDAGGPQGRDAKG